jgi:ATP-binding cassette, subfamily B, bacterial
MQKIAYIRKYYSIGLFSLIMIACILLGCLPALQIVLERNLIDVAIQGASSGGLQTFTRGLIQFIVLLFINLLLKSLLQFATERHNLLVAKKLDTQRVEKCKRISFPIMETQNFHQLNEKSEKAGEANSTLFASLQSGLKCTIQVVTSFVVLFYFDARTALVAFVLLIPGVLLNKKASRDSVSFWGEYIQNMRHANYLSSLLLHREYATERKIFNYNAELEAQYSSDCSTAIQKNSKLGQARFFSKLFSTIFSAVYTVIAILLLIPPVKIGSLSIGSFLAAFTAIATLRSTANQLCASIFDVGNNFEKLKGFFSLMELEEEVVSLPEQSNEKLDLSKGIEFQQVSFKYPNAQDVVLENVSFILNIGMHYALVGENGCGKTTLVKLLVGLYKPTSGRILFGSKELSKLSQEEKRQLFSVIFQDLYRYPLSVRENVSLGSDKMQNTDAIQEALKALQFDGTDQDETELDETKLDASLGLLKQDSVDLSGGQWQKLAVARSMLSPAPIVILDEPNAALDPMSELAFYRVYEKNFAQKTTLFISHRLGAVKTADKILVIKDKHLIAMDSHDELMNNCTYYKQLYETQRGLYYETK